MDDMYEDHITMQDGKIMVTRNGERTPIDDEITMPDGTRIGIDGTIMMPDGTMRMMAEGETMLMQGQAAAPENMSDSQFKEAMEDEELRDQLH